MQSIITALVASRRHPNLVNIFVDGEFLVQVHIDLINKYELHKGKTITSDLHKALEVDKRRMFVRQLALSYATYKQRTEFQVRKRLFEKDCETEEITAAVDFLKEFGYLNDARYADMYIRDAVLSKGYSAGRIKLELLKRGVDAFIVTDAINSTFPHDQTIHIARRAAEKKLRAVSYRSVEKQQSSVRDYLARQGFTWNVIKQVIDNLFIDQ